VYRLAGTYTVDGDVVKVKIFFQKFTPTQDRTTLETVTVEGKKSDIKSLASRIRQLTEDKVAQFEAPAGG
ncbi:MAG: hypothetical protein K8R88_04580, partial [Armatimonadetes bacterium]|nr:hypothetical protein [Armatimonadota bacterium]